MKVEGVMSEGKPVGRGEINVGIRREDVPVLTMMITARPRPNKKEQEEFQPMERKKLLFPLVGRNLSNLFRLVVEGKDSLIKKALREKSEIGFDEKLANKGNDEYVRIRGYSWAFTFFARSGNEEGFLIMKPKEFYPIVYLAEKFICSLPEYSAIVTKDLDVLICSAKKGELTFRTVESDRVVAKITDAALITALACDLDDRIRIEDMYPAKFGSVTLSYRQKAPCLKVGNRYYKTDRQGLITLQLLAKIASGAKGENKSDTADGD